MGRPKIEGVCKIWGCDNPLSAKGFCQYHYNKDRLERDPTVAKAGLRGHPFYHLWFERKSFDLLCDEWLQFQNFIDGVSPKPEGNYFLVRLDGTKPFGPNNFKWQEHLKRKKGELKKEWYARKWAARQAANPSMESDRNIKRNFGIDRKQYNEILKSQNNGCAICGKFETSINANTGTIKKLAIDHCHNSKKIRGLLCWRCNGTIGKVNDDIELLQKMINYLIKHKGE